MHVTSFSSRHSVDTCPMQSAVLARVIPAVCPSVARHTIVRFSASGRTIPPVSGEVKFIQIFAGEHLQRER